MSLARLLAVDELSEEVSDEESSENLKELIGDVYDPTEEFK